MATAGLYRRSLPSPPAIDFSSAEGKKIFSKALHKGTMEGFFRLISYFQTQSEPAYCGLASLSVVLNALSIDPGRKWKGPWRWFDESMLDCCEPLEVVKAKGISFGKVVCLAHCTGAKVEAFRTNQTTIADFRNFVIKCSSSENCHLISSYDRGVFKQVTFVTDCSQLVKMVSEPEELPAFENYLEDIKLLRRSFLNSDIVHVPRPENLRADSLARSDRKQPSFIVHMDAELPIWFTKSI